MSDHRYRSQAQKQKFVKMYQGGEITKEVLDEWNTNSKGKPIPYRLKSKKPASKQRHKQY